jgi:hypothetical protein
MHISKLLQLVPALLALTLSAPALAGGVPKPDIPKAVKGEQCVEDTAVMRRNHMDYLRHHRDDALREGIRTETYSLKACLDCHVEPAGSAQAAQGEHFCKSCHAYAAVHVDCFECHNSRPEPASNAMGGANRPDPYAGVRLDRVAGVSQNTTGATQ